MFASRQILHVGLMETFADWPDDKNCTPAKGKVLP